MMAATVVNKKIKQPNNGSVTVTLIHTIERISAAKINGGGSLLNATTQCDAI
jgi:hypothetical protein